MPVTLRQLEALIRLTQARARVDLSPEAKIEHARDVIELTKICHSDLFCDGIGTIDVNRGRIPSSKMSQNSKIKRFLSLIQKRSEVTMKTIFTLNELKETASNGGLVHHGFGSDFREMIDKLNEQGCLLKKGPKLYQLLVV
ncbi:DNA helicase MCM8-like [Ctenocephalides felis]|uniref:DNA helicase MCM8-like n=1 Tax=Ctenocephalides felis TaxID=7515 RepID=UPI000E6E12AC|nr:DNA helicase MCM8-like [Ctenocephalides felis]